MRIIYKYELKLEQEQIVNLPIGYEILSAKEQRGKIVIYAMINLGEKEYEKVVIRIVGTGGPEHSDFLRVYKFIDTVMVGVYVWHIFYKNE